MAGWTIGMKVWAVLLAAVPPATWGWICADSEICAWTALGCAAGALGVGVFALAAGF